jgi:Protein of unknown function (DUF2971)
MSSLDLPGRRHVPKRFLPEPMRPFLYKYLPSQGDFGLINIRDVLVGSVMRLSSPRQFNDPFELTAEFVMTATDAQKLERFESLARAQAPHLGWRAIQERVRNLMSSPEEFFYPNWQQSLSQIRSVAGIYCFAGSGKNHLMWGHYASHHKGVCLQFERVRDIATLAHAFRVDYHREFPVLNWIVDFHKHTGDMLFSKDSCWAYEKESRIFIYGQAGRYVPFAPDALRKLIFGCEAEPKFIDAVTDILAQRAATGHPPIDVHFAKRHPKRYRLVVPRALSPI